MNAYTSVDHNIRQILAATCIKVSREMARLRNPDHSEDADISCAELTATCVTLNVDAFSLAGLIYDLVLIAGSYQSSSDLIHEPGVSPQSDNVDINDGHGGFDFSTVDFHGQDYFLPAPYEGLPAATDTSIVL